MGNETNDPTTIKGLISLIAAQTKQVSDFLNKESTETIFDFAPSFTLAQTNLISLGLNLIASMIYELLPEDAVARIEERIFTPTMEEEEEENAQHSKNIADRINELKDSKIEYLRLLHVYRRYNSQWITRQYIAKMPDYTND